MKRLALLFQVMVATLAWLVFPSIVLGSDAISIPSGSYAAIAYSPSTGNVCSSYNAPSRARAESDALSRCSEQDAEIVCWVEKGFCALALGSDKGSWGVGWTYGNGASSAKAQRSALEECRKRTTGTHIEMYLSSDGQVFWQRSKERILVSEDSFAAIAYSPSTGKYCLSYDHPSKAEAERKALSQCDASDTLIACWVNRGFCALAVGSDKASWGTGISSGSGASTATAKANALANCGEKTSETHVEVYLSSDGQVLWERAKHSLTILSTGEVIQNGEVILPAFDSTKAQDRPAGTPAP